MRVAVSFTDEPARTLVVERPVESVTFAAVAVSAWHALVAAAVLASPL